MITLGQLIMLTWLKEQIGNNVAPVGSLVPGLVAVTVQHVESLTASSQPDYCVLLYVLTN